MQHVGVVPDLRAGPVTSTGNPFDVAIERPGYFALETAQSTRDVRSGHFRLDGEPQQAAIESSNVIPWPRSSPSLPVI